MLFIFYENKDNNCLPYFQLFSDISHFRIYRRWRRTVTLGAEEPELPEFRRLLDTLGASSSFFSCLRDEVAEVALRRRDARDDFLSSSTSSVGFVTESVATESVECPHTCCSKSDNCFSIRFCSFAIALSVLQ